jgi:hypothetical protein
MKIMKYRWGMSQRYCSMNSHRILRLRYVKHSIAAIRTILVEKDLQREWKVVSQHLVWRIKCKNCREGWLLIKLFIIHCNLHLVLYCMLIRGSSRWWIQITSERKAITYRRYSTQVMRTWKKKKKERMKLKL